MSRRRVEQLSLDTSVPGFWVVTRYDDVRRLFADPVVINDPRVYEFYVPPREGRALQPRGGRDPSRPLGWEL
jgi:hypothetical protein